MKSLLDYLNHSAIGSDGHPIHAGDIVRCPGECFVHTYTVSKVISSYKIKLDGYSEHWESKGFQVPR